MDFPVWVKMIIPAVEMLAISRKTNRLKASRVMMITLSPMTKIRYTMMAWLPAFLSVDSIYNPPKNPTILIMVARNASFLPMSRLME